MRNTVYGGRKRASIEVWPTDVDDTYGRGYALRRLAAEIEKIPVPEGLKRGKPARSGKAA